MCGDNSHVITVNYDDGSNSETIILNPDNSFELNHIYFDDVRIIFY